MCIKYPQSYKLVDKVNVIYSFFFFILISSRLTLSHLMESEDAVDDGLACLEETCSLLTQRRQVVAIRKH